MSKLFPSSRYLTSSAIVFVTAAAMYIAASSLEYVPAANAAAMPAPLGSVLVVNSTADTTDGLCSVGPDNCTLREAIEAANAGPDVNTITFDINIETDPGCIGADCTIQLSGALPDLSSMTIAGPQALRITVKRTGGPRYRIFTVASGMTVNIANLAITGGYTAKGVEGTTGKKGNPNGGPGVPGGGIYNPADSILNLAGVTLTNNRPGEGGGPRSQGIPGPGGNGGGIYNLGTLNVDRSTISGNFSGGVVLAEGAAYGWGGGIFDLGTSTISNSTITNNSSGEAGKFTVGNGAGLYGGGGTIMRNTIVSGNYITGFEGPVPNNIAGSVSGASAFNLIGTGGSGGVSNGVNANQVGIDDARLGPLQNNGGPTSTHALLAGSAAIDQGDDGLAGPTTDQRGTTRPLDSTFIPNAEGGDGSDIGAYEREPVVAGSTYVVNSTGDAGDITANGICDDGTGNCTLRAAVDEANADMLTADTITFDIPPADPGCTGGMCTITLTGALPDLTFVTINGPTDISLTVRRNGGPRFRIFTIAPVSSVTITNMNITGGHTPNGAGGNGDDHPNGFPGVPGGGIYNPFGSTLMLAGVTLTGNMPGTGGSPSSGGFPGRGGNGGAIYNVGTLSIDRSTISGNMSGAARLSDDASFGHGGGIYDLGVTSISNSTITNNTCGEIGKYEIGDGGGIVGGASTTLRNTIVSGNYVIGGSPNNIAGSVNSASAFNLVGTGGSGGLVNGTNANQVGVDSSLIGPLQTNGGPTLTHALMTGSPAIDQGENGSPALTTDQLNQPRPADDLSIPNAAGGDGSDIGSFEVQLPSVSGVVSYSIATKPVPDVLLSGAGSVPVSTATSADGSYLMTQFGTGGYTVTPSKPNLMCGPSNGIFADDASIVARHVVGLETLTGDALSAAKVGGLSNVTSFDAALIARWAVGICSDSASVAGQWRFSPVNRTYASVLTNLGSEHYSAYMIGDVNGDWSPTGALRASVTDLAKKAVRASMPVTSTSTASEVVVPLRLDNLRGEAVTSYQFSIDYDPSVIDPSRISAELNGTLAEGLSLIYHSPAPGTVNVVVYGTFSVIADGVYVRLKFSATGSPGSSTKLTIRDFRLNSGDAHVETVSGLIAVE